MSEQALAAVIKRLLADKYNGVETEAFQFDSERICAGEPYEYVLGQVDFLGARIDLSFRPMIPRPETAFWVARAIEELQVYPGPLRIADTFAGAGNVGIAILKHVPQAVVEFFELDPILKSQIELNLKLNNIQPERALVVTASDVSGLTGMYDAIFAVPPYVPYDALPELDPEMINFEPHLAFFAHDDGHEFYNLLINSAAQFLNADGTLYMEADIDDNEFIRSTVQGSNWKSLDFWPDPYGDTPNVVLRK